MAKFLIRYALGGGFGGVEMQEWEEVEARDLDEAETMAYEKACDEYDSYDGLHGLRSVDDIMEEDELSREEAEDVYNEERESWLEYEAKKKEEE